MKRVIMSAAMLCQVSTVAFANGNDVVQRGSQAWFAEESIEHVLEALVEKSSVAESDVSAVSVEIANQKSSVVTVEAKEGTTHDCQLIEKSSRGGRDGGGNGGGNSGGNNGGRKADVVCAGIADSDTDLTRGSNAWFVVEGIEHSLRSLVEADQSVLTKVSAASSELTSEGTVIASISTTDNATFQFVCIKKVGTRPSLACAKQ